MEKLKELLRVFGSALASAVAAGSEHLPYRIQVTPRLTGSLWSLSLVVAALPPHEVGTGQRVLSVDEHGR